MPKSRLKQLASREVAHLFTIQSSDRPWHLVVVAGATISLTIFAGALTGELPTGILASLGAMIILNQPSNGNLVQRQSLLFLLGVVMSVSFGMGMFAQVLPELRLPILGMVVLCLVILGRYLRLPPPGCLFIMMASVIALFMPVSWEDIPSKIAIVAGGSAWAWFTALLYNVFVVRPESQHAAPSWGYEKGLLTESVIVAVFVLLSLEVGLLLNLSYPYWVPVSCFIILQGMHLRTMWIRQLHRILGTACGVFIAWFLLAMSLPPVGVAIALFLMFLWIETMVVRHYGLAVVMVTPLTVFIAEYSRDTQNVLADVGVMSYQGIVQARFIDTLLGCSIALVGGLIMHSTWLRKPLMILESKLISDKNE